MSDDLRRVVLAIHIYEGLLRNSDPETVLDAILNDPGIEVVELPEPQTGEWDTAIWPCKAPDLDAYAKVQIEDDGRIFLNGIPNPLRNPDQARVLAAALLAAARKAEADA